MGGRTSRNTFSQIRVIPWKIEIFFRTPEVFDLMKMDMTAESLGFNSGIPELDELTTNYIQTAFSIFVDQIFEKYYLEMDPADWEGFRASIWNETKVNFDFELHLKTKLAEFLARFGVVETEETEIVEHKFEVGDV